MKIKQMKELIFIALVLVIAFIVIGFALNLDVLLENILAVFVLLVVLIVFWKFDFIIFLKDYERAVAFRFGKFVGVRGPGWAYLIPMIESFEKVDLRRQVIDIPKQDVITKDGIELKVDAIIYLKVKGDAESVRRSIIEIEDYKEAARLFTISGIRNAVGKMELDKVVGSIALLNDQIHEKLQHISDDWGVNIESVQLKDVDIPATVLDAMHEEKAAVQKKLSRMESAQAHEAEIGAVKKAAEQLSDKALSYYYIKALEKMSEGQATKIVFPMELSKLAEAIGANVGSAKGVTDSKLIASYAPLIATYLKKEKQRRSIKPKKKAKKKPKKKAKKKK